MHLTIRLGTDQPLLLNRPVDTGRKKLERYSSMSRHRARAGFIIWGLVGWCVGTAAVWAEEARKNPTVQKTADNLHFQLPPDWPVEKRGGVVAPVPVEEYLAMKFSVLESRLQAMEQRLSSLDVRLRILEERAKANTSRTLATPPPGGAGQSP